MKRLVLIDGHAILHRAYFALPKTLTTRRGELVNAVYGFARMLFKVIEDLRPTYLAVAFDLPKPTFRHQEFIGYQAQRPKMDTELKNQIARVYQVVQALNLPIFTAGGYEADDVIGSLARQAVKKKVNVVIVTGDKDIMQLVGPRIKVYAPVKGFSQAKLFGPKEVEKLLGVKPAQIVDYKALAGDPSDNYPGVPGVGPKTAEKLLGKYQDLDAIYEEKNLEKIDKRVANKLVEGAESAALSRKLAQIVTNVPLKLRLGPCRVHDYDPTKVREIFTELGFKSLMRKLVKKEDKKQKAKTPRVKSRQAKLF